MQKIIYKQQKDNFNTNRPKKQKNIRKNINNKLINDSWKVYKEQDSHQAITISIKKGNILIYKKKTSV